MAMNYISFDDHGGECCGITHIHNIHGNNFREGDMESLKAKIIKYVEEFIDENMGFYDPEYPEDEGWKEPVERFNRLFEMVLTDQQLYEQGWAKPLKDFGFKLVSRFRNDNSDNICNVLHYVQGKRQSRRQWMEI